MIRAGARVAGVGPGALLVHDPASGAPQMLLLSLPSPQSDVRLRRSRLGIGPGVRTMRRYEASRSAEEQKAALIQAEQLQQASGAVLNLSKANQLSEAA